jgi:hypothetical protein
VHHADLHGGQQLAGIVAVVVGLPEGCDILASGVLVSRVSRSGAVERGGAMYNDDVASGVVG